MTQKELIYFKTIAEEKSISKAAKKLYITQPSLSQAIQRIEDNLGINLFMRTTKGLILTYAGERYYLLATKILKMYEDFQIEISDINNLKTGRINIGITNFLATYVLPIVLPEFKAICPFIDVYILEKNSTELESALLLGEVDFAIMHEPTKINSAQIDYDSLLKDPFLLTINPNHPLVNEGKDLTGNKYPLIDLKLFENEPFIMLNKDQRIRHVVDKIFKKANIEPKIVLTLKNFETAKRLATEGLGATFVPLQYSKISYSDSKPAYFYVDEFYEASWTMCIATNKTGFLSKADKLFIKLLKDKISSDIVI